MSIILRDDYEDYDPMEEYEYNLFAHKYRDNNDSKDY